MVYTILDFLIYYQKIRIVRKFSNFELKLYRYFFYKTGKTSCPITINGFVFFFVSNEDYYDAKEKINLLRLNLIKKAALIRMENTLLNLIWALFPDIYINDIDIKFNNISKKREILLNFLTSEERKIAVGRNGAYIKAVNDLFENYIHFQTKKYPINLRCEIVPC